MKKLNIKPSSRCIVYFCLLIFITRAFYKKVFIPSYFITNARGISRAKSLRSPQKNKEREIETENCVRTEANLATRENESVHHVIPIFNLTMKMQARAKAQTTNKVIGMLYV